MGLYSRVGLYVAVYGTYVVSRGNISKIFENFTEINILAYVISKFIPLGKHVERS